MAVLNFEFRAHVWPSAPIFCQQHPRNYYGPSQSVGFSLIDFNGLAPHQRLCRKA